MNIGWPEGIYLTMNILFLAVGLIMNSGDRGKTTASALAMLLWVFITLPLLWWGGFFA